LTLHLDYDMIDIMGIAQAILKLRAEYANEDGISPYTINNGQCDEFAETLEIMGFGVAIWGSQIPIESWSLLMQEIVEIGIMDDFDWFADCHCFTFYREKYYGSECPQGCEHPDQLPIYQRNLECYGI